MSNSMIWITTEVTTTKTILPSSFRLLLPPPPLLLCMKFEIKPTLACRLVEWDGLAIQFSSVQLRRQTGHVPIGGRGSKGGKIGTSGIIT